MTNWSGMTRRFPDTTQASFFGQSSFPVIPREWHAISLKIQNTDAHKKIAVEIIYWSSVTAKNYQNRATPDQLGGEWHQKGGGTPPCCHSVIPRGMTSSPPGMTDVDIRMTHHPMRMTYFGLSGMTYCFRRNDKIYTKEWHVGQTNDTNN